MWAKVPRIATELNHWIIIIVVMTLEEASNIITRCKLLAGILLLLTTTRVMLLTVDDYFYAAPVGEQCIALSLSGCLSLCLRAYLWNRWTDLHELFCTDCPGAVAGSSSGSVAIRYVLPVLWMTSRLAVMAVYYDAWLATLRYRAESDVYECLACRESTISSCTLLGGFACLLRR